MSTQSSRLHQAREIDTGQTLIQSFAPPTELHHYEGVAFSPSGNVIAIAASGMHVIYLFRKGGNGGFGSEPYCSIDRGLKYPHDVNFCRIGDRELLAVANRSGSIPVFEKMQDSDEFNPEPAFEISGPKSNLNFSDGVAFVPPQNDCLAACNLKNNSISFYCRLSHSPLSFEVIPCFELKHWSLDQPDGLAFSRCGNWLAVASHAGHCVSIYMRGKKLFSGGLKYHRRPICYLNGPELCYPHSVAFMPETNHLVVTNAGANYICVYAPEPRGAGMAWGAKPVLKQVVIPDRLFQEVNSKNKMEGGAKGVAVHGDLVAICSPEIGIKILRFNELARI